LSLRIPQHKMPSVVWWAPSWTFCAHGNGGDFNQTRSN